MQTDETFVCNEKIQLEETQKISEVEFNLSESEIDPFETMYGEINEDNFHQMMEGNDRTYSPLFSDKEFLNDGWHKFMFLFSDDKHENMTLLSELYQLE